MFTHNRYTAIPSAQIAYFYIRHDTTALYTFQEASYILNQSLETIAGHLKPSQFYRVTRQYLISFEAISEVEPYLSRKLLIHLKVPTQEKLLIDENNATAFLQWMDAR